MTEMNAWERRCAERTKQCISGALSFDHAKDAGISEYMDIFRRYCSVSKGSPRDFYYTEPPDYDPRAEVIVSAQQASPDIFEIRTQQTHSHCKRHVYLLALEPPGWRLFAKQISLDDGELLATYL